MRIGRLQNVCAQMAGIAVLLTTALAPATARPQERTGLSAAEAQRRARAAYPGRVVGAPTLRQSEGRDRYEVVIRSGRRERRVEVDAGTGALGRVTSRLLPGTSRPTPETPRISATRAAQLARAGYPGWISGTPRLVRANGRPMWDIIVRSGQVVRRVRVNARDGRVERVAYAR